MLKFELRGDRQVIARIEGAPRRVQAELTKEVTILTLKLERHIKNEKLSGQVLNVVTGNLRRSIHAVLPPEQLPNGGVVGRVAQSGDVKYGAIHEFGGKTPAHEIRPKAGNVLAFVWQGKQRFFTKVNHPGSTMPERSFMRSGLADMREEIIRRLHAAVARGMALREGGTR